MSDSGYDSVSFPDLFNSGYNIKALGLPDTLEFILNINERALIYEGYKYSKNLKAHTLFSTDTTLTNNQTTFKIVKN